MKVHLRLGFTVLSFVVALLIHISHAGALCESAEISPTCAKPTGAELFSLDQCEIEKKAAGCDEWEKSHPELALKARRCSVVAKCPSLTKLSDYYNSCKNALGDSWTDMGAGVIHFVMNTGTMDYEMKQRESFFAGCTTPECKRSMLGAYADYFTTEEIEGTGALAVVGDPTTEAVAHGLSAKTLYRKLIMKLKEKAAKQEMDQPFIKPWSKTNEPVNLESHSVMELVDGVLEKAGIHNPTCYDPAILMEMRCYAVAAVVDPMLAAGAVGKIARVAGIVEKSAEVAEVAGRTSGTSIAERLGKLKDSVIPKSLAERHPSLASAPAVAKKVEEASKEIDKLSFPAKVKTVEDIPWEKNAVFLEDRAARQKLAAQASTLDATKKKSLVEVYNRMNDKQAFKTYMEKLSSDAVDEVRRRGLASEIKALEKGEVPRSAVLRVLVQRSKARGDGRISTIVEDGFESAGTRKPSTNKGFRSAVAQGPFFDKKYNARAPHGRDTHFLQRDFMSDVVAKTTGGNPQEFWDFLGSSSGINYWVPLFDAPKRSMSLASPEFMKKQARKYLLLD